MNATLDELLARLKAQDGNIQTLNASVEITASTGGTHQGSVQEIPSFAGYIFMRRPGDLRVLLLVPVVRSRALDMVSDGKDFKLLLPTKNKAIVGADEVTATSKNGLENLRPYIIRDALLIPSAGAQEFVALTKDSRILPTSKGRKELIEEPDYDINIFSNDKTDQVLHPVRVIHIGGVTLQPYEQDIYDKQGRVVTTVVYDRYQKFGTTEYPTSIVITRKLDEYQLRIDITKAVFNGKLDDEQFALKIPDSVTIQKM